jgi:hypothetical protein
MVSFGERACVTKTRFTKPSRRARFGRNHRIGVGQNVRADGSLTRVGTEAPSEPKRRGDMTVRGAASRILPGGSRSSLNAAHSAAITALNQVYYDRHFAHANAPRARPVPSQLSPRQLLAGCVPPNVTSLGMFGRL